MFAWSTVVLIVACCSVAVAALQPGSGYAILGVAAYPPVALSQLAGFISVKPMTRAIREYRASLRG